MAFSEGTQQGFLAPGLVYGTLIWAIFGVIATGVAQLFVKETPRITKAESKQLSLV
eukprot:CAMPEP_0168445146 /NCGR_PEP_ID=MMETSP0228-20121227/45418_1 /TAXON_ID=133427 /ORGANISM="Protoceratium reticulatum, Strain CCCM 535 (=CCMP 1889)" /LENGTH=55 /DNA_ID=CAMNT_0008459619 /DNA_START=54 /DNA_END=218 /DNA_ORIENTATION=+